jgi:hypothetical protein
MFPTALVFDVTFIAFGTPILFNNFQKILFFVLIANMLFGRSVFIGFLLICRGKLAVIATKFGFNGFYSTLTVL